MANGPRKIRPAAPVSAQSAATGAEGEIDFSALVKSLPRRVRETVNVDVTRFFPEFLTLYPGKEKLEFTYCKISAPGLIGLADMAKKIQFQRPEWSPEMLATVALLTAAHVAPASSAEQVYILYAEMAERLDTPEFLSLLSQFTEAFPHLTDYVSILSGKKKS